VRRCGRRLAHRWLPVWYHVFLTTAYPEYRMYRIELWIQFLHLTLRFDTFMSRDPSLLRALRDAVRQAARSLETLKLLRPDDDPRIERLLRELRAASASEQEPRRETLSAD
jgi:hypothetical protein